MTSDISVNKVLKRLFRATIRTISILNRCLLKNSILIYGEENIELDLGQREQRSILQARPTTLDDRTHFMIGNLHPQFAWHTRIIAKLFWREQEGG